MTLKINDEISGRKKDVKPKPRSRKKLLGKTKMWHDDMTAWL